VISQLNKNGGISNITRNEIERFLADGCMNISGSSRIANFPRLAEFVEEKECVNAIKRALDRISRNDTTFVAPESLRYFVNNYVNL